VGYIFEEIWHGKSVLSGPQNQMALVRWDRTKPLDFMNTVVMSKEEAKRHDALPLDIDLSQHYGQGKYYKVVGHQKRYSHRLDHLGVCIMVRDRLKDEELRRQIWDHAL